MSTPEERGTDRGKAHWISGICPAGQSLPATAGAGGVLERIPSPAGPGGAATAGGPVHGLRRALLSVRGGVERYGLRLPLHNLVPEWNDLVYRRKLGRALERLLKTNDFPEFTGRVCPALCEAACTCGLNGQPVTVKDNELGIIEEAWEQGLMSPRPPETRTGRTVAVVGSGPAGLSCAQRLNRRGHSVTVFERADRPGGLLMYGIPNMKLEKSVVQRRLDLMAAEGIAFRTGVDAGRDVGQEELREQFDAVVLCCGAAQPRDLDVPGRAGVDVWFAVDFLTGATRALLDGTYCPSAQGKDVVIVGGGDTGNDCVAPASARAVKALPSWR